MKKRRVRPEELELWQQVARTAEQLPGRPVVNSEDPSSAAAPRLEPRKDAVQTETAIPRHFTLGNKAKTDGRVDVPKSTSQRIGEQPVSMDAKTFAKMKRGKPGP